MMKIMHRTRDSWELVRGSNTLMEPASQILGVRTPVTHAALTLMDVMAKSIAMMLTVLGDDDQVRRHAVTRKPS